MFNQWISNIHCHEHLCLEDDYTNDLPVFIEKRIICNYESVPVPIYSIKLEPDLGLDSKLCLKGKFSLISSITLSFSIKTPKLTENIVCFMIR